MYQSFTKCIAYSNSNQLMIQPQVIWETNLQWKWLKSIVIIPIVIMSTENLIRLWWRWQKRRWSRAGKTGNSAFSRRKTLWRQSRGCIDAFGKLPTLWQRRLRPQHRNADNKSRPWCWSDSRSQMLSLWKRLWTSSKRREAQWQRCGCRWRRQGD